MEQFSRIKRTTEKKQSIRQGENANEYLLKNESVVKEETYEKAASFSIVKIAANKELSTPMKIEIEDSLTQTPATPTQLDDENESIMTNDNNNSDNDESSLVDISLSEEPKRPLSAKIDKSNTKKIIFIFAYFSTIIFSRN